MRVTAKKVVKRVESGMDRREIAATTYQMRNPFTQFRDGVAGELDSMCYFEHAFAADLCPKGGRVLDVCCGRGLLIPFLRYRGNAPSLYVGVDLKPTNAVWKDGIDPRKPGQPKKKGWGFKTVFVESNVASMAEPVREAAGNKRFDLVVYTSSIEHMQPRDQRASLEQAAELTKRGGVLYLTCPVTEEGESGYDAQYAAHVYEPKISELERWLDEAGWDVEKQIGLLTKVGAFRKRLTGESLQVAECIHESMPREQALVTIPMLFPDCATEMALVCTRR